MGQLELRLLRKEREKKKLLAQIRELQGREEKIRRLLRAGMLFEEAGILEDYDREEAAACLARLKK